MNQPRWQMRTYFSYSKLLIQSQNRHCIPQLPKGVYKSFNIANALPIFTLLVATKIIHVQTVSLEGIITGLKWRDLKKKLRGSPFALDSPNSPVLPLSAAQSGSDWKLTTKPPFLCSLAPRIHLTTVSFSKTPNSHKRNTNNLLSENTVFIMFQILCYVLLKSWVTFPHTLQIGKGDLPSLRCSKLGWKRGRSESTGCISCQSHSKKLTAQVRNRAKQN